jgi:hypothetical protein
MVGDRRAVVVASPERYRRDRSRLAELVLRTEKRLITLEARVRDGRLTDAGAIGRAAERIVRESGPERLFELEIGPGRFLCHYDEAALDYEEQLLAGRYVLLTSLPATRLPTEEVLRTYRGYSGPRIASRC